MQTMDEATRTQRSRMLSMWLRHKPERGGLTLSREGWAAIPAVIDAFRAQGHDLARADLDDIIRRDVKGRFEVEADRIRARYGHSIELEEKPHPGMPPAVLFHGTARRFVPRIMERGLHPMKRKFVHLSPDRKTAREVGGRRDQDAAILVVAAHEAHAAGVRFYPRGKGIWLSDPIPPAFLRQEEDAEGGRPPSQQGQREARAAAPGAPRRRRPKGGFLKR